MAAGAVLSPTRYRILDVGVFHGRRPSQAHPGSPPLIDVEVLSPDDKLGEILDRFEELRAWGVKHLWLIDPAYRSFHILGRHGLIEVEALEIPELGLRLSQGDLFE